MSTTRKIVHIDCDSFYASIEVRDNPALADLPVAVGGAPTRRGVVATCNYEARKYGVHSAMASATARKLCPHLIIIRPDMVRYKLASQQIQKILRCYTRLIEPLSLDEAFLDLTDCQKHQGDPVAIATEIRVRIAGEVGITVSAGIAPNKFLAKVASDWNKPNGQFAIHPDTVQDFVRDLPASKLFGVGKVTAARLRDMGIVTCGDLRVLAQEDLDARFGSFGKRLYELCRGIDHRPVQPTRTRKSLSVESTFAEDRPDLESCLEALPELHEKLSTRLDELDSRYRICKQIVKIKFFDFVTTTVETVAGDSNLKTYESLLTEGYKRGNRAVRLLGIGVRLATRKLPDIRPENNRPNTDLTRNSDTCQLALFK